MKQSQVLIDTMIQIKQMNENQLRVIAFATCLSEEKTDEIISVLKNIKKMHKMCNCTLEDFQEELFGNYLTLQETEEEFPRVKNACKLIADEC